MEYILQQKMFDELRSFIKKGGKTGSIDMMAVESIPGTSQPQLNIIRYMTDSGEVDDYGKQILTKNIIIENLGERRCDKMMGIIPYDMDRNIILTGACVQYRFVPTEDVESYFRNKYYDSIVMMLYKLRGLDEKHKDDHDLVISMIKDMWK